MADAIALARPARAASWRARRLVSWLARGIEHVATSWRLEVDRRRLFLWLPVFYGAGIALYFAAEREPSFTASAIPLLLAAIVAYLGRARLRVLGPALAIAMLLAGYLAATHRTLRVAAPILGAPTSVTITGFAESIERTSYGGRMIVSITSVEPPLEALPERVRLTFRAGNSLVSGDRVRLKARLTPPAPPAVPGGFDFQREAWFLRLGAVGLVTGGIAILSDDAVVPWRIRAIATIDAARNTLTERIVSVIGGSNGAIAAALVTGKRGQIAEADNEAWRGAGIYHIISISGLHMALAAGLFFWSARLILALLPAFGRRNITKKIAALVAMAGTIAYDIFSGHDVATERSMIMTLVMLGAILFDRPALAMRNLAISGLIVMTLRPETLLGPSFQMSFGAVAGLVAYGEWMRQRREKNATRSAGRDDRFTVRALRIAGDFAATSLIAGLATAPFQAFHFHRLNPYGLFGNAIAVPLCSMMVMPAALLGVLLYPLGLDAPAWLVMGYGIQAISAFAREVASVAGAIATVTRFTIPALLVLALGLAFLTLMTTTVFRVAAAGFAAAGLLLVVSAPRPVMILGPDGKHALVQTDTGLTLLGRGRPVFALQQWLPGEGDSREPRDPALAARSRCDRLGCTAERSDGAFVAHVTDPAAFPDDCERALVIVTPLLAPASCTTRTTVYDRSWFSRYGATYLYQTDPQALTLRAETARHPRSQRPWLPSSVTSPIPQTDSGVATDGQSRQPHAWDPSTPDVHDPQ